MNGARSRADLDWRRDLSVNDENIGGQNWYAMIQTRFACTQRRYDKPVEQHYFLPTTSCHNAGVSTFSIS
jgi:hypothetical protein